MSKENTAKKDHWSSDVSQPARHLPTFKGTIENCCRKSKSTCELTYCKAYSAAASFVPKLTTTVVKYLDPQPTDRILDIGCGDGVLTAQIASALSSGEILGLDASVGMITDARHTYPSSDYPNCSFHVQDCTSFDNDAAAKYLTGQWDKVFSNAALHWILCKAETRMDVISAAYTVLKPGGTFVFEMGGFGNVGEVYIALIAALVADGIDPAAARARSPWFFPDEAWMSTVLARVGFNVEKIELEYRPTPLTPDTQGKGGLEGWLKLMGANFLEVVSDEEKALKLMFELLQKAITRRRYAVDWICETAGNSKKTMAQKLCVSVFSSACRWYDSKLLLRVGILSTAQISQLYGVCNGLVAE